MSIFMINSISNGQIRGESYTDGFMGQTGARIWLFLGFVFGFGAMIASVWILFAAYIVGDAKFMYPGFGLFFQNLFIFSGSVLHSF